MFITQAEQQSASVLNADPWTPLVTIAPKLATYVKRLKVIATHARLPPSHEVIRPPSKQGVWTLYFAYSPTGKLFPQHRFTLSRLNDCGFSTLVVLATSAQPGQVDNSWAMADALVLKKLKGFDFSGYSIGLDLVVRCLEEVDVLVLNDSVFGPFSDLRSITGRTPWFQTGFTASYAIEPHHQSYAFFLKGLNRSRFEKLRRVFWSHISCNMHGAVAYLQESRLARIASSVGSVGTVWTPRERECDLTMAHPLELLDADFPFLKRSTLGKFAHAFNSEDIRDALSTRGHPIGHGAFG